MNGAIAHRCPVPYRQLSAGCPTHRRKLLVCAAATVLGLAVVLAAPVDTWWATRLLGLGFRPLTLSRPLDVTDGAKVVGLAGLVVDLVAFAAMCVTLGPQVLRRGFRHLLTLERSRGQ